VTPFIAAGAGFLLAVLWFDLMFDVQIARHPGVRVPEEVLASIAGYYRRVTTAARPMNRLVAAVMLATLGTIIAQIARGERPHWVGWASLPLAGGAVLLAALHTVPSAVRLGGRSDPLDDQVGLARSIWRDHLLCAAGIFAVLVIQLSSA
jgi:peptidoglycan/LPS O-acetylase OafA/YrhL